MAEGAGTAAVGVDHDEPGTVAKVRDVPGASDSPRSARRSGLARILTRPRYAGPILLLAYFALSLLNDPHAFLGTDTGGKVATLAVMAAHHSLHPNVGYWAARWDPTGKVHPLWYTSQYGGQWLQLSTLPMTYLALPLYHLGGYRLILLLPMLGGVATAFVARGLARRIRPAGDGWWAFWMVGLASPIAIYALDFWEHTLGVACMAGGVLALLNVLDAVPVGAPVARRRLCAWSLVAGLLFGVAATMRTEAFVYAVVGVGVGCVVALWRRHVISALSVGALAVVAAAVPFAGNILLEHWALGSTVRASREQSTVSAPGFAQLSARAKEAAIMFSSLNPATDTMAIILGAALVVLLVYVVLRSTGRDQRPAKIAAGAVVVLYVTRAAAGLGFVPGLMAATPVAGVALALAWRRSAGRLVALIALIALPIVWLFDALGGVAPQWAGRYILTTGTLLMAVGVAFLPELRRWVRRFFVGLAVAVTVFGLAWMSMRTHQMAHAQDQLAARPEPVLVSGIAHLVREGGAHYLDHKWLTAQGHPDQQFAANVVRKAGYDEFGLVRLAPSEPGPVPTFDGWRAVHHQKMALLGGVDLQIVTYQRA